MGEHFRDRIGWRFGRYILTELIGRGGMGTVYKAYDDALQRDVAIKVLLEQFCANEEYLERFYREARAAARLVHPNVVTVHDVGRHEEMAYIVMEYVKGRTLKQELRNRAAPLAREHILQVSQQVLQALDLAHRHRILHRDIKSDNIMFTPQGLVKVLDFGIAQMDDTESLTQLGDIIGTAEYMSPEQALGEELDVRSDIYSFGIVLFEMLTGELPFTGDSIIAVIYQHINDFPVSPLVLNPQADPKLATLVLKSLAKEPERRYQSAAELLQEIDRCLEGLPPETLPAEFSAQEVQVEEAVPVDLLSPFKSFAGDFFCELVGREEELATLQQTFDQAAAGQGQVVFLGGEAGVGKTRLASELQGYALQKGARSLTGVCLYRDTLLPYFPFLEALRNFFHQTRRGREYHEHERLKQFIRDQTPELEALIPFMGTQIGQIERPQQQAVELRTDVAQNRFFDMITQLLREIARDRALVLLLDDVHWADSASFLLLHYLARAIRNLPILILATYRPEELELDKTDADQIHPFRELMRRMSREDLYKHLKIERLELDAIVQMLDRTLRRTSLSEELRDLVVEETEGNPFFIIEVLKLLRDEGIIAEQDGLWSLKRQVYELHIPDRVYDVIVRRLDRLSDEQRELLQVAAVEGERFTSNVLAQALEISRIKLLRMLHQMERVHQLVSSVGGQYQFEHTKIREVLYDEIPSELRQAYHLIIADCIEREHQNNPEPVISSLATHLYLGGDLQRATPYLVQSGTNAARVLAFKEAARYFEQALDAMQRTQHPKDRTWTDLLLHSGRVYYRLGDWDKALEQFEASLQVEDQPVMDPIMKAEVLFEIGRIKRRRGDWESALKAYDQSLSLFEQAQNQRGKALVYQNLGDIYLEQNNWNQANQLYQSGLQIAEEVNDDALAANIHTSLGVMASIKGEIQDAIGHYETSIQRYDALEDRYGLAKVYNNLAMAYEASQEWEQALGYYRKAQALCRSMGSTALLTLVYLNSAKMAVKLEDVETAEDYCQRAIELLTELGDQLGLAEANKICGMIHVLRQDWSKAESFFQQGREIFTTHNNQLGVAEVSREMGLMCVQQGNRKRAVELLEEAKTLFNQIDAYGDAAQVESEIAALLLRNGIVN